MTTVQDKLPHIIFISGASGAGKTSLIKHLAIKYSDFSIAAFHFDSIGVPPVEEMNKQYGSPREWQRAMTNEWVKRLIHESENKELLILEGQTDLTFIESAFKSNYFENYTIILIHCSHDLRHTRLQNRGQTELINDEMDNWANYLHKQATSKHILILDSGIMTIDEMVTKTLCHSSTINRI
jgi:uridine kinase